MCAGFGCYCRPKIMKQQPELQWLLALRKDLKCAYCVNFCIYWKSSLMMGGKGQQNCWVYCWYILFCCVHVIACWNSIPTVSQATMMVVHGSQSTVNASASDPEGVVLCNTFKWDIVLFILIKNLVICVPSTTADCNSFKNQRNKKLVWSNYNALVHYKNGSASDPEGVVLCNTFKWDILLFVRTHTF